MQLDNPNIIKLYEIYEHNQAVYMVSEYLCFHSASAKVENSLIDWIKKVV